MTQEAREWGAQSDTSALLCRGRSPSAMATFEGTSNIHGELCFYPTPLGLLITARLDGLEKSGRVTPYRLCLDSSDRESRFLPTLYAKEGQAWARTLTRRLDLDTLQKHRLFLCETNQRETHILSEAVWSMERSIS